LPDLRQLLANRGGLLFLENPGDQQSPNGGLDDPAPFW
jgi:hypothetical protein